MCGFGGIVGAIPPISATRLSQVAELVRHRGPDYTGISLYERNLTPEIDYGWAGFFHNRLAIIDLDERSNQPFEDSRSLLVFNGEIYNFRALRVELEAEGVAFATASDTEVLFQACKVWGHKAIPRINGMFAFAYLDKVNRTLLLARDRIGIKPLYYALEDGRVIFASEADTVVRLAGKVPEVDKQAVDCYRLLQYVQGSRSIWKGIKKLLPGHYLDISIDLANRADLRPTKYWDPYEVADGAYQGDDLSGLLVSAIGMQLVADVPIGVFLSSGVDSSTIAAIIAKHFRDVDVDFYTVGFSSETPHDESQKAAEFVTRLGLPALCHHRLELDGASIADHWSRLYRIVDEPFGDHAVLLNWAIAEEASRYVKVVLSGDGADEVFEGYGRYSQWRDYRAAQKGGRGSVNVWIARFLRLVAKRKSLQIRGLTDPIELYAAMLAPSPFGCKDIEKILAACDFMIDARSVSDREDLPRLVDFKSYLPDAMLFKVDRSSMAASIEARVPFLDNDVVSYGLCGHQTASNSLPKAALRSVLRRLAPDYDVNSKKMGFSFPIIDWMRNQWKQLIMDIVHHGNYDAVGIDRAEAINILKQFYRGDNDFVYELWILVNLLLWHRTKLSQLGLG